MILSFRPIKVWPEGWHPEDTSREASPFKATYASTLEILDRELHHLGATDLVLQVDASERDCRLDGQLRADAKVRHPGVILSFTSRVHGALSYPCDRYGKNWAQQRLLPWQHNLRAIALGLEALRKVERYGIAERGEQYAGYREIGTGIQLGPVALTREQAARVLADVDPEEYNAAGVADLVNGMEGAAQAAYHRAAKVHHPDVGGDPDVFRTITQARDVLLGSST